MGLLTIGAFARAVGLTPKALRLYDELGVLAPAAVDAESGYRFYDPAQVAHARLIGRLREIGMPLATIRDVCALPPVAAANAVAGFWQQVSADTAARARLMSDLVTHLSGKDKVMSEFRYAASIDQGLVRTTNEDQAYAGEQLVAVADGTGGPLGAAAAAAAIDAVKPLELTAEPGVALLSALASAITAADRTIRALSPDDEPVTTLTALLRRGSQLALVHIGDTRAYLLRNGDLTLLTQDHTVAPAPPGQPALLVRALGWGHGVEADLALRTALPGDRYLLCSDGLSTVVPWERLQAVLTSAPSPDEAVAQLIAAAHEAGAPDNIACAAYFSAA